MPWRGWRLAIRRRRTRPSSLPMTGMRQRVTALSINRSILVAVLVMGAGECGSPHSRGGLGHGCWRVRFAAFAWRSWSCAGRDPLADAVGQGVAPVPLAGLHELAGQHAAHDLLHPARDAEQRGEVDAGLDAHRVQAGVLMLGADAAGGAGREWAACEAAD